MKIEDCDNKSVLGPDFAHRVVERIRKAKRRRQLYRCALISTVGCALAAVTILALSTRNSTPQPSDLLTSRNHTPPEQVAALYEFGSSLESDPPSFRQPLVFFFPSAGAVGDFQSSEASYWHFYDPWWNPKP